MTYLSSYIDLKRDLRQLPLRQQLPIAIAQISLVCIIN